MNQTELKAILVTVKAIVKELKEIEGICEKKKHKMTTDERFNLVAEYIKENGPVNKTEIRKDLKPVGKNRFAEFFNNFILSCEKNHIQLKKTSGKIVYYSIG